MCSPLAVSFNRRYELYMKPHVIFFCTSCLFGYEPRDLSSRLTTELEWEKAQMLRSWAPIGPLTWPWGPRPGSWFLQGDHASQPNAFKAWNSPPTTLLLPLTHMGPSYACTIHFLSKYSQARAAVFQGKSKM